MARAKIALIGAGMIGGTLAHIIARESWATWSAGRHRRGTPVGKALDIVEASSVFGKDSHPSANDYADQGLRRLHRHRRHRAQAGHEPRRPVGHQPGRS